MYKLTLVFLLCLLIIFRYGLEVALAVLELYVDQAGAGLELTQLYLPLLLQCWDIRHAVGLFLLLEAAV